MTLFNKTKIVATIGPSSESEEMLEALAAAGVDVFRLNFSHGEHDRKAEIIQRIRNMNERPEINTAILADLQGPKIRLGLIKNDSFEIHEGEKLTMTTQPCEGDRNCVHITYDTFARDAKPGNRILIDDGKIEARVTETNGTDTVVVKIIYGGTISSRKGVNLPDTDVSLPSLTPKDEKDLEFAIQQDVAWIALSFVRDARDLKLLKDKIKAANSKAKVIAKIEKPQAVKNMEEVIREADGIMIARGDLGVEMPIQSVPMIQKRIVNMCLRYAKPVIIATQMLESMITNAKPTRAEVTDIANAVLDGADALMLSGETAVGKYPVRVIELMTKVITSIEKEDQIYSKDHQPDFDSPTFLSDAVCYNACKLSGDVRARAILGMTRSGYTAFMTSSYRPRARIFIFSDDKKILNTLSLVWGVQCYYYNKMESTDQTIFDLHDILKKKEQISNGDIVVNLASMPIDRQGRNNMVKVSRID